RDQVALGAGHGASVGVEHGKIGSGAKRFADVAGHGLAHAGGVLHPVELPDVPNRRIAHRGVGHAVVVRVEVGGEDLVGDAAEGVGAAGALLDRVEVAGGVGVRLGKNRAGDAAE